MITSRRKVLQCTLVSQNNRESFNGFLITFFMFMLSGFMYSMAAFGPVLGFLLGAYLLSFHMDSFSGSVINIGEFTNLKVEVWNNIITLSTRSNKLSVGWNVVGRLFAVRSSAHYRSNSIFLVSQGELIKTLPKFQTNWTRSFELWVFIVERGFHERIFLSDSDTWEEENPLSWTISSADCYSIPQLQ